MPDEENIDQETTEDVEEEVTEEESDQEEDGDDKSESEEETEEETDKEDEPPEDIEPEVRNATKKTEKEEELDDLELDPEDAKVIEKMVRKAVTPLQSEIQAQRDEVEINTFLAENPDFNKYKPQIKKYMAHDVYKQIPVKNIAAIVASRDLMAIGAKKERQTQKNVEKTKESADTTRPTKAGSKDWHTASKEDYEAMRAKVLGRQGF